MSSTERGYHPTSLFANAGACGTRRDDGGTATLTCSGKKLHTDAILRYHSTQLNFYYYTPTHNNFNFTCAFFNAMKSALFLLGLAATAAAASLRGAPANPNGVDLVTFDGAKGTTYKWKDLNDPVMGGESSSTWTIDTQVHKTAVWDGEVRSRARRVRFRAPLCRPASPR